MDPAQKQARENRRNRHIALCEVAKKVCDLLDEQGVTQDEGCLVRQLAERMWQDNYNLGLGNMQPLGPDIGAGVAA